MNRVVIALLLTVALPVRADKKGDVADTGTTRAAQLRTMDVSAGAAATTDAPDRERNVTATPAQPRATAPLSGALQAMLERQMRKNQPAIDSCVAEELQRNPKSAGDVTLAVTIAERKVSAASVVTDGVNSAGLRDCLLKSARAWQFSTKGADFTWPVTVRKR
jgi:hypothetical protein